MKKLMLALDELRVESFATEKGRPAGRGTVRGHSTLVLEDSEGCVHTDACPSTEYLDCTLSGCPDTGWQECGYSYGGTCGASPPQSYYAGCESDMLAGFPLPPDCV